MASKLIVNEIEHTDGSGTAVTMAKATIADATITTGSIPAAGITGVLPVGVTGGSGLNAVPAPAAITGHIVQYRPIKYGTYTGAINSPTSSATWQASNLYDTITFTAGNRIVAMANLYYSA